MSIGVIYVVFLISNIRGIDNVVRVAKQAPLKNNNIPFESTPVVSAVLLECPKYNKHTFNSHKVRGLSDQQLMVNIRVNPSFHVEKVSKFLILDEVYDPRKRTKAKIMAPYLIEISRGEPVMMYPLEFTKSVKYDEVCPKKLLNNGNSNNNDVNSQNNFKSSCAGNNKHNNTHHANMNYHNHNGNSTCNNMIQPPIPESESDSSVPNNKKSENFPEQESLNRVIDRITDAFGSSKNSKSFDDIRENSSKENSKSGMTNNKFDNSADNTGDNGDSKEKTNINDENNSNIGNGAGNSDNSIGIGGIVSSKDISNEEVSNSSKNMNIIVNNKSGIDVIESNGDGIAINTGTSSANGGASDGAANSNSTNNGNEDVHGNDIIDVGNGVDGTTASKQMKTYNDYDSDDLRVQPIGHVRGNNNNKNRPMEVTNNVDPHDRFYNDNDMHSDSKTMSREFKKKQQRGGVNVNKFSRNIVQAGLENDDTVNMNLNKQSAEYRKDCEIAQNKEYNIGSFKSAQEPDEINGDGELEDYDDEMHPIHFVQRSAIKRSKLGRDKLGHRSKTKLNQRQRKRGPAYQVAMDDEDDYYYDDINIQPNNEKIENAANAYCGDEEDSIYGSQDEYIGNVRPKGASKQRMINDEESDDYDEFEDDDRECRAFNKKQKVQAAEHNSYIYNRKRNLQPLKAMNYNDFYDTPQKKSRKSAEIARMEFNKNSPLLHVKSKSELESYPQLKSHNYVSYDYDEDRNQMEGSRRILARSQHNNRFKGFKQSHRNQNSLKNYNFWPIRKINVEKNARYKGINSIHKPERTSYSNPQNGIYRNFNKSVVYLNENSKPHKFLIDFGTAPSFNLQSTNHKLEDKNFGPFFSTTYLNPSGSSEPKKLQMDTSELLNPALITESPNIHHLTATNSYYKAVTVLAPRSSARVLLSKEPAKYLPKKPPFSKIIDDPYLETKDKLSVLDIIDPRNKPADRKMNQLTYEVDDSTIENPSSFPVPAQVRKRKVLDKSKKKRSFIFYDDLEMRDTLEDNDYNFDNTYQRRAPPSASRHVDDDVMPCGSCGGKGKKPNEKETVVNDRAYTCRCRNQRKSCQCETTKNVRSVSDAWYSVFNMSAPLPFLTTKVNIFRKRQNIWWKIAPSISLNSLSGIFANANLSILFSSHVDIFQLEKSLRLQNHQLLIPKDDRPTRESEDGITTGAGQDIIDREIPNLSKLNNNPYSILAIDNSNTCNDLQTSNHAEEAENDFKKNCVRSVAPNCAQMDSSLMDGHDGDNYMKQLLSPRESAIRTIGDLGYFPTSMNLLERCPNDKNHLCLNMLEDRVPAYSIKIKMPFRENALIYRDVYRAKITQIVTDATTKDVLQLSVDVINEGLEAHEFFICVANCQMPCVAVSKTSVRKYLVPHISETVTFLLPLILESSDRHKKFHCDVEVRTSYDTDSCDKEKKDLKSATIFARFAANNHTKTLKKKVVAIRPFIIAPENRCFCVWECNCHCMPKLESYVDFNVCQKLTCSQRKKAGLTIVCQPRDNMDEIISTEEEQRNERIEPVPNYDSDSEGRYFYLLQYALLLLAVMLLLGFIKATLGLMIKKVNKWGYGYVQPGCSYECASRFRRFLVNTFFFIVFPFLFWCKCFTPSEEDLLVASTEWQCSIVQETNKHFDDDDDFDKCDCNSERSTNVYGDDEDVILSQHIDRRGKYHGRLVGGEDVFDMDARLSDWTMAFKEHFGGDDDDDDADEEENTKFVLQALVESRESLKKLLKDHSSQKLNEDEDPKCKKAVELVRALKSAQIVYRTFEFPVGNIRHIPFGRKYCVQGYFLPSIGAEYEFVNYNPMAQHRCIASNGKTVEALHPPVMLCPKDFSRVYADKLEVLQAGDLSVNPPSSAPCINISSMSVVATSVAKLASDQSYREHIPQLPLSRRSSILSNTSASNQPPPHFEKKEKNTADNSPTTAYTTFTIPEISDIEQLDDESQELVDDTCYDVTTYHCDTIEECSSDIPS